MKHLLNRLINWLNGPAIAEVQRHQINDSLTNFKLLDDIVLFHEHMDKESK